MSGRSAGAKIASLFPTHFLHWYARAKLATDPVYAAVAERLRDHPLSLLDVGCGVGLMAFYLREAGFRAPIRGIDYDRKKVAVAKSIATRYEDLEFSVADARDALTGGGSVLLIDVLHYLDDLQQRALLTSIAASVPEGGLIVIRDTLKDGSWRSRVTYAVEAFARSSGWMKAGRLNFPTISAIRDALPGFDLESQPLWGSTPFNNYLFVANRSSAGMTKR